MGGRPRSALSSVCRSGGAFALLAAERNLLVQPRRAGSPAAGQTAVWRLQASSLCSEFEAPRSSLLSTAEERKWKEPWHQVKQALHEVPLLCRADVKFLASLATWKRPQGPPDVVCQQLETEATCAGLKYIFLKLFGVPRIHRDLRRFSWLMQYLGKERERRAVWELGF